MKNKLYFEKKFCIIEGRLVVVSKLDDVDWPILDNIDELPRTIPSLPITVIISGASSAMQTRQNGRQVVLPPLQPRPGVGRCPLQQAPFDNRPSWFIISVISNSLT